MSAFSWLMAFLKARLDEDEAHPGGWPDARMLREVEAKRAILDAWQDNERERPHDEGGPLSYTDGLADGLGLAVQYLAAVYSGHPDYGPAMPPNAK